MPKGPPIASHVLLLTACIAPKPEIARLLRRADPALRLQDYASALRSWFRMKDPRIGAVVFADNSGYPLDELKMLAADEAPDGIEIEFHSFDYPAPSSSISYGYPEMLLVNEMLASSPAIRRFPYFAKITGRYQYPGFSRLLDRLPPDYRVALDTTGMRPWPCHHRSNPICGFGLALFQTDFYRQHLLDIPAAMRPAPPWSRLQFVETMLYDRLAPLQHEAGVILRWPCNCEPVGVGANGDDYRGFRRRLRAGLRSVNRRIFPSVWL